MSKFSKQILTLCLSLGAGLMFSASGFAATTHVITADQEKRVWHYDNGSSSKVDGTPVLADDLKIDDVVEIVIKDGLPHGFVAHGGKQGDDSDLVQRCGETEKVKPNAVLRELCDGSTTKYAQPFIVGADGTGTLRLQVLSKFKDDFKFWCIFHKSAMQGVLSLKP